MMLYPFYEAQSRMLGMARDAAATVSALTRGGWLPGTRLVRAGAELIAETSISHARPPYRIETVVVDGQPTAVHEEATLVTPFGTLLHFRKETPAEQPRVLVLAPMSGHFATLLRATVETLLQDCDVYITDWHNARDVPAAAGSFGMDEFVGHVIQFMETLGPGAHLVAVCQPAVPAVIAASVMAADRNPSQPRSMTLMAGPIDTRILPTKVNTLAMSHPIEWFERNMIQTVPLPHAGVGRRVYPGFLQLTAFMSMNIDRHLAAYQSQLRNLIAGNALKTEAHRRFYDEYLAVSDLPAEFYLETVQRVFQEHRLPRGLATYRGAPVDPGAIRNTALLVVEGERDDICSVGQTMAALDLCTGIPDTRKQYHLQTGVGHYGVFSGRRWQEQVYPKLRQMIQDASTVKEPRRSLKRDQTEPPRERLADTASA